MILATPVASWRDEHPREPQGPYAAASDDLRSWIWELGFVESGTRSVISYGIGL